MRKAVSYIFLLLATCVWMAYSVVPHHHHETIAVCFQNDYCPDNNTAFPAHEHGSGYGHDYQPDPAHNSDRNDDCFVKSAYVPAINERQMNPSSDSGFSVLLYTVLSPDISGTRYIPSGGLSFRPNPIVPFFHGEYIARSSGLRAPPFC